MTTQSNQIVNVTVQQLSLLDQSFKLALKTNRKALELTARGLANSLARTDDAEYAMELATKLATKAGLRISQEGWKALKAAYAEERSALVEAKAAFVAQKAVNDRWLVLRGASREIRWGAVGFTRSYQAQVKADAQLQQELLAELVKNVKTPEAAAELESKFQAYIS